MDIVCPLSSPFESYSNVNLAFRLRL